MNTSRIRRSLSLIATLLVVSVVGGAAAAFAMPSSTVGGAEPAKKRCHFVKKKVHGKVKRVRVCTKAKPQPQPKSAALRLEQGRTHSATIGAAGGTVGTTSTNGTAISVAIPAGALAEETVISVTPVAKLSGIPGVRLLSGVELGPDGTALAKAATVSLSLPRATKGTFGVAWFGVGRNVHRYPIARSSRGVTIRVAHFSGVGIGEGDPGLLPKLETALTLSYAREVRPLLRKGAEDDSVFEAAVAAGTGWLKATELVGLQARFARFRDEANVLLEQVFKTGIKRASERCRNHDLTQLYRIAKIGQKMEGFTYQQDLTTFERIDRCARFELEMELDWSSAFDYRTSDDSLSIHNSLHVRANRIPLASGGDLGGVQGAGPLDPTAWHGVLAVTDDDYSCTIVSDGPASPKAALQAMLDLNRAGLEAKEPELHLLLDPGDVLTPQSPGCLTGPNPPPPAVYAGAWPALYPRLLRPDGRYLFTLRYTPGEVVGVFGPDTQTGSTAIVSGTNAWSGTLTLKLHHTPIG